MTNIEKNEIIKTEDLYKENIKLNYAVNSLLEVGVTQMKISFCNYIKCYNKEKTICDIIRNKENENIEIVTDELKMYVFRKDNGEYYGTNKN